MMSCPTFRTCLCREHRCFCASLTYSPFTNLLDMHRLNPLHPLELFIIGCLRQLLFLYKGIVALIVVLVNEISELCMH